MNLLQIVRREPKPAPWAEGDNIPWHDPAFSMRMLREHLSQEHDAASRRTEIIDRQVDWIHHQVLRAQPARILDLGCGPGLYAERLARLGHTCKGIDYSPASIAYATKRAKQGDLDCTYVLEDIRTAAYGTGYSLVMLIFGELNVFRPVDARTILRKAHAALVPGGVLLLEPHTEDCVQRMGEQPATWYTAERGLFADGPYLCLEERLWDAGSQTMTTRFFIVDAGTGDVTRHAQTFQAYSEEGYRILLADCGFDKVMFYPSLQGVEVEPETGLLAIVARKVEGLA